MKIGRNDPCHCGSGKKYKHCCIHKDEESRRAQQFDEQGKSLIDEVLPEYSPPALLTGRAEQAEPPEPPDPRIEAINARWEEFEAQDYEGQIALFLKTLDEPELMDDEMAFELLNTLYKKTVEHHEPYRYDALVDQLRERLPEVYAQSAHYYLQNRINNAIIAGDFKRVPDFFNELAQRAGRAIDTFNNVVDQLAYHGKLSALIEANRIAWPTVEKSGDIVPWGIDEFADHTVQLLVFDYLEQHGADPSGYPELFERIKAYSAIEPERITTFLNLLAGVSGRQWTREDFTFKPKHRKSRDGDEDDGIQIPKKVQQNLFDFSLDFQGHLRREQNVPLTKSELGREQIVQYLVKRVAGELEPRKSMFEAVLYPNKPGPKKRSPEFYLISDDDSIAWLCPDEKTFNLFLTRFFQMMNHRPYNAAAMFEFIPAWLDFLNAHQLISTTLREKTLLDLKKLHKDLLDIFRKTSPDPALQKVMENLKRSAA